MKSVELKVKINLSEDVSKEEQGNITENVLKGLMDTAITSDDSEAFTEMIEVEGEALFLKGDIKTGNIETV